jgi:integrase
MAWSERLASGRYRGVYRDARGRRRSVTGPDGRGFTQAAQAKRAAAEKEIEVRNPRAAHPDGGKIPWGEWVDEYWWPTRKVEASTAKADKSKLETHLRPRWGHIPLEEITRTDVQAWIDALDQSELSASTIQKIFRILSGSLKAAVVAEPRRLDASPCVAVKLPTIPPATERYLTRDEVADLVTMMPDRQSEVVTLLLVGTGMRWGEMAALHRHRVDLDQRRLDIVEAYDAEDQKIKAYPKGRARRSVPLTDELAELLASWMAECSTDKTCGVPHQKGSRCDSGLVIPGHGVLDYYHWEQYVWRRALVAAEIGKARIHDLRHTYASWLVQDGVPIEVVSELLGHASLSTTQRYAHLADSQWDRIREVLGGSKTDHEEERRQWVRDALRQLAEATEEAYAEVYERLTGEEPEEFAPHLPLGVTPPEGATIVQLERKARSHA